MSKHLGKQTVVFAHPPRITAAAAVGGKMEREGPLGKYLDASDMQDLFGCENWESAEGKMLELAATKVMEKAAKTSADIDYIVGGDLLGQLIATTFGLKELNIALFGIFGACSTIGEALQLGAMLIDGDFAKSVIAITSSHFCGTEKEFRFPLAYGTQRPPCASWTVTGSGALLLEAGQKKRNNMTASSQTANSQIPDSYIPDNTTGERKKRDVFVTAVTTGKVIDFGCKDKFNMGACMAPAAADTIEQHFKDTKTTPAYYDKIITGDLGKIGQEILIDLLNARGYDIKSRHMDCGLLIYDGQAQDTHAGGSGCACSAVCFASYLYRQMELGSYKRILFVPTGALLSSITSNEGKTVPGIAHAVVIESEQSEELRRREKE